MLQMKWSASGNNRDVKQLAIKVILTAIIFLCTFRLFYLQINNPSSFYSDISTHIRFAVEGRGYSYLMPVLGVIIKFTEPYENIAIALFESSALLLTWYALNTIIIRISKLSKIQAFLISTTCIFLSSLYIPYLQPMFYRGGIVTQPWHNITFIFMRLFATLTVGNFIGIIGTYQKEFSLKNWIGISLPLFLATAVKPNFLIGFSWTLLFFLVLDFFREKSLLGTLQCIKMGTTVLPAVLVMFLQSKVLYPPSGGNGLAVVFFSSSFFSLGLWGTVLKIIRGLSFATIVVVYNKCWKVKEEAFIIVQYIVFLLVAVFLTEYGQRNSDGNFYWGLYCGGYFLMALSFTKFISSFITIMGERSSIKRSNISYLVIGWILFAGHFISGVIYFILLSTGGKGYAF